MPTQNIVTVRPQPGVMTFNCRTCHGLGLIGTVKTPVTLEDRAAIESGLAQSREEKCEAGHTMTINLHGLNG